jgi:hypothetical protein
MERTYGGLSTKVVISWRKHFLMFEVIPLTRIKGTFKNSIYAKTIPLTWLASFANITTQAK